MTALGTIQRSRKGLPVEISSIENRPLGDYQVRFFKICVTYRTCTVGTDAIRIHKTSVADPEPDLNVLNYYAGAGFGLESKSKLF
jgi:hypothetical protein